MAARELAAVLYGRCAIVPGVHSQSLRGVRSCNRVPRREVRCIAAVAWRGLRMVLLCTVWPMIRSYRGFSFLRRSVLDGRQFGLTHSICNRTQCVRCSVGMEGRSRGSYTRW